MVVETFPFNDDTARDDEADYGQYQFWIDLAAVIYCLNELNSSLLLLLSHSDASLVRKFPGSIDVRLDPVLHPQPSALTPVCRSTTKQLVSVTIEILFAAPQIQRCPLNDVTMLATTTLRRVPALARTFRISTAKRTIISMVEPAKVRIHKGCRWERNESGIRALVMWPKNKFKRSIETSLAI